MKKLKLISLLIVMILMASLVAGFTVNAQEAESEVPTAAFDELYGVEEGVLSSDGFAATVSSRANVVGGKSDLRIILVASYELLCENDDAALTIEIGGKTITKGVVDDLHVYQSAMAAGNTYTAADGAVLFGLVITEVPNDAWENVTVTLTTAETVYTGELAKDAVITHQVGQKISSGNYGFQNHHGGDLEYTVAWVTYFWDGLAREVEDGNLLLKVAFNGVLYDAVTFNNYIFASNNGYIRIGLEHAGITGIEKGETYTLAAHLYDTEGNYLYYTDVHTVTSPFFSGDFPAQNVELPTEGLTQLEVDNSKLGYSGVAVWNETKESVAQLFDGNTSGSKMGGNVAEVDGKREVTVTFSLTEEAKLDYYTFYTGNDTAKNGDRNPMDWTLYGKVDGEWVVLSQVGVNARTGLEVVNGTPFSYATAEDTPACIDYKVVFTTNEKFQLNELQLFTTAQ